MAGEIAVRYETSGVRTVCEEILASLPEWFGIPESSSEYAELTERHRTAVATVRQRDVGLLTFAQHSPASAEILLLAVSRHHHRNGVGTALVSDVETTLSREGVLFLQVKTLSARASDVNYAGTREFYRAMGFFILEERGQLWAADNPAVQLIKAL